MADVLQPDRLAVRLFSLSELAFGLPRVYTMKKTERSFL